MIKNKPLLVIALMWILTIATSFMVLRETEYFRILSPVYVVCMIGSIVTVKKALKKKEDEE